MIVAGFLTSFLESLDEWLWERETRA